MNPSGPRARIRRARPSDVEALEHIEAVSFTGDRLSRRMLNRHLVSPTCDAFVAELAGEAVGYALMFYRSTSTVGRLYSIATLPEAAGRGIGARLVAACEKAARERGCASVRLEVRTDNAGAIRLYKKLGYDRFGRHEDYYEDGAPALRFTKPLRQGGGLTLKLLSCRCRDHSG